MGTATTGDESPPAGPPGPDDRLDPWRGAVVAAGLDRLWFDNRLMVELPVDPSDLIQPRQVPGAITSRVRPVAPSAPALLAWSDEVSDQLGIDRSAWTSEPELMATVFSGGTQLDGMDPHAMRYGGHQFGNWAGQLGDGRAIALGEAVGPDGVRRTLQLKGAGPTPYSRGADGLAVLRSSVREFLCSEAMHHLGIPTTRALSLVLTGDKVVRDMFYDGNPRPEPGAVVCRVSPSFLRFGNFQILAAGGELDLLAALTDYTIREYYPHLLDGHEPGTARLYEALFAEVAARTLETVVGWMRVGFVHGVMNTDNMSILGETIDYGPYGWLEDFDPGWTPNTTDRAHRRYRYGQQPQVAQWNLLQLANALVQLTGDTEPLEASLTAYGEDHDRLARAMWRSKLGLDGVGVDDRADELVRDLFELLTATETDMTIFFRRLGRFDTQAERGGPADRSPDADLAALVADAHYRPAEAAAIAGRTAGWLRAYADVASSTGVDDRHRRTRMEAVNPKFVLRNYMAQLAIDAAEQGDHGAVAELLDVLRRPYDEQPDRERHADKRPEWARDRPGCSMLSCSS